MFHSVLRGLDIPEEYTLRMFRNELVVFCAMNARILRKQHSLFLRDGFAEEYTDDNVPIGPLSIRTYLHYLLRSSSWGDSICLDMISRMWGLRITVLDASSKLNLVERRIRHNLPMMNADVVMLFTGRYFSAVLKQKEMEIPEKPIMELKDQVDPISIKVPVRGLVAFPGLRLDFTPYDEEDDDSDVESSDPFWKTWRTYEQPRSTEGQENVSIPKELYKVLVAVYKDKMHLPYTDMVDIMCPFCPQEFKFSRTLKHHCRKEHSYSLLGGTELQTLLECCSTGSRKVAA